MKPRGTQYVPAAGAALVLVLMTAVARGGIEPGPDGVYHVRPGEVIQAVVDRAGADPAHKTVRVHAGTYRPAARAQALVRLNQRHDGITLEAEGEVTLTAANADVAERGAASFPAVVNHVIYLGDGLGRGTVVRGFKITGGNRFVTDREGPEPLEPRLDELRKTEGFYGRLFFYTDGAAIKVFGRSAPTLERLEVHDNFAAPCAGGISIEQRGFLGQPVLIRDCILRHNQALVTGSAVDLLPGSAAEIRNCLFVGNLSNRGNEHVPIPGNIDWPTIPALVRSAAGYLPESGSGALTVFPRSVVQVERCTFTGNQNGVDDHGGRSLYRRCLFWRNDAPAVARPGRRYELDVPKAQEISDCQIHGEIDDLRGSVDPRRNTLGCADPDFDAEFRPRNPAMKDTGFAPGKPAAP